MKCIILAMLLLHAVLSGVQQSEHTTRSGRYHRAGKSRKLPGSNVWTIGVDTAKDAIYSKLKVTTSGPGYCHFPIAYQQEFFNQFTSEEVRCHFSQG